VHHSASRHDLTTEHRNPVSEVLAGCDVGGVHLIGVGVDVGLRARTQPEPEPVQIVFAARRAVPARSQAEIDPVHVVLGGEHRK